MTLRTEATFLHAVKALLWSEGMEDGELAPELEAALRVEWEAFCDSAEALGFDPAAHRATAINPAEGDEAAYAAHDWVLTRNRHGSGFWDGDWHDPWCNELTRLCHAQGEMYTAKVLAHA